MHQRNFETRSHDHCRPAKAISNICSECVSVALVIQYEKRMRVIILSFMTRLALTRFATLSYKPQDYWKKSD